MSNYPATEKGKLLHIEEVLFQTQVPSARGFGELEGFRDEVPALGVLECQRSPEQFMDSEDCIHQNLPWRGGFTIPLVINYSLARAWAREQQHKLRIV